MTPLRSFFAWVGPVLCLACAAGFIFVRPGLMDVALCCFWGGLGIGFNVAHLVWKRLAFDEIARFDRCAEIAKNHSAAILALNEHAEVVNRFMERHLN